MMVIIQKRVKSFAITELHYTKTADITTAANCIKPQTSQIKHTLQTQSEF